MEVKQIYELINLVTAEVIGTETVVQEDLSNVVDIGTAILNANALDNYVRSLVNHIGKVIFVNRVYSGSTPSVFMDGWEFGSVLEKITAEMPEAVENESWELQDGASYDPNIFHAPIVSATFYNNKVTFEIEMSFTERQVKESFSNVQQLNGFLSMLYNAVDRSMTVKIDGLTQRTINALIAETVYSDYQSAGLSTKTGIKAVNLLYMYNQKYSKTLTAAEAITDPDFIRYAAYIMGLYQDRLTRISTLFNIEGKDRFTPRDMQRTILLSDFKRAADAFLNSDTYNKEFVKLPDAEIVPYWQGSGKTYSFADTSKISIKTPSNNVVEVTGVLGLIRDYESVGVTNTSRRVTTNYNPKGEFFNNFYKFDCGNFISTQEQAVVFFVA